MWHSLKRGAITFCQVRAQLHNTIAVWPVKDYGASYNGASLCEQLVGNVQELNPWALKCESGTLVVAAPSQKVSVIFWLWLLVKQIDVFTLQDAVMSLALIIQCYVHHRLSSCDSEIYPQWSMHDVHVSVVWSSWRCNNKSHNVVTFLCCLVISKLPCSVLSTLSEAVWIYKWCRGEIRGSDLGVWVQGVWCCNPTQNRIWKHCPWELSKYNIEIWILVFLTI